VRPFRHQGDTDASGEPRVDAIVSVINANARDPEYARQETTIQGRRARVPIETDVGERFNDVIHQMMRS
jgi:hypothetical protein